MSTARTTDMKIRTNPGPPEPPVVATCVQRVKARLVTGLGEQDSERVIVESNSFEGVDDDGTVARPVRPGGPTTERCVTCSSRIHPLRPATSFGRVYRLQSHTVDALATGSAHRPASPWCPRQSRNTSGERARAPEIQKSCVVRRVEECESVSDSDSDSPA